VLVHALKQPVKGQHQEDQDHPAGEVAHDTETEEPLVSGDVVDRRGRVAVHKKFGRNIDEAQWADDDKEQVPETGYSAWIVGRAHLRSLFERAYCKCLAPDTQQRIPHLALIT
jgi:hypothetical protein